MKHKISTPQMLGRVSLASKIPPVAANDGSYVSHCVLTHSVFVFRKNGSGLFVIALYVWVRISSGD